MAPFRRSHFPGRMVFLTLALSLLLVLGLSLLVRTSLVPAGPLPGDTDPDRPDMLRGVLTDAEYIMQRDEYIALLRGAPYPRPNIRLDGVRQLEAQQQQQRLQNSPLADPAWTALGPAPIPNGQTTNAVNPVSGRVLSFAVDPVSHNTVYVGAAQGGVWRSTNGGTSWTPIFDRAGSMAVNALAIDPADHHRLWVGTGEPNYSGDSYSGVGLYRIDNADTTSGAAADLLGPIDAADFADVSISKILVDPADSDNIFVATATGHRGKGGQFPPLGGKTGIYRSSNATAAVGTISFTQLDVTTDVFGLGCDVRDMVIEPGNANNLIAAVTDFSGCDPGIYRSTNALAATPAFSKRLSLSAPGSIAQAELAINKVGATVTVYAATSESQGRVRVSTDGGASWSAALAGGQGYCGGQCFYDIAIAVDPGNANNVYLGGSANSGAAHEYQRSTDGGASFTALPFNTGLHADTHALVIDPTNANIIYQGDDGGAFKSVDGGQNWTSLNTDGFGITQFMSIAVHSVNQAFILGGTQDNGTQLRDTDSAWTRADFGDGGYALIDQSSTDPAVNTVTMYHTYFNQTNAMGFARVTNKANAQDGQWDFFGCGFGGATANGITCDATNILFYAPMALGPGSPNTLYFGSDVLYRSTNAGATMTKVSQQPLVNGRAISSIGISPQTDNVRLVGIRNGQVFASNTAGATTMTDISGPWTTSAPFVGKVLVDPNNSNVVYVGLGEFGLAHVWKNGDLNAAIAGGGTGWTAISNGLPDVPVNSLAIDPDDSTHMFAGTDIGVYASFDGGSNWAPYGTGLPTVAIFDMAIQNDARVLRVATHGRAIWEITIDPTGGATATPTVTPTTAAATDTPTVTTTPTSTRTATGEPTSTRTSTVTRTPTNTRTATPTRTGTVTRTPTSTHTLVTTATPTEVVTGTVTATPTATLPVCTITFTDVPPSNPFYDWIRCLACRQVFSGYADNTFRPFNSVTRGQAAKIVANAANFNNKIPVGQQTFKDVPHSNPFWLFVERAVSHGVISGYSDANTCGGAANTPCFKPGNNLTRGQMAKIVANAKEFNNAIPAGQQTFADVPSSNPFWVFVERIASRGIISGYNCGAAPAPACQPGNKPFFLWGNNVTRGQTAKIVGGAFFPECATLKQ